MAKKSKVAAALQGADEVIFVPTAEIVEESLNDLRYLIDFKPNRDPAEPRAKRKRARKRPFFEEEALQVYGGYEGFLVRTAVIRARDYDQRRAPKISTPEDAWPLLQHLQYADQEHFVVLAMDTRMKLRAIHESAVGGSAAVNIERQHVVKVPLLVSARSVIIAHNHPSESREFSEDDIHMTREVKKALDCVGITLLDHILVTRSGMASFMEQIGAP